MNVLEIFYYLFVFFIGVSVGSFINVLVDRLPAGKSVVKGRSFCDHCGQTLGFFDLVPLISFFLLGAKCRYCKGNISWQYPLVELISGLLFIFTYFYTDSFFSSSQLIYLIYFLPIVSALLAIFLVDMKYRIIPNELVIFLTLYSVFFKLLYFRFEMFNSLLSGLLYLFFFLFLFVFTSGKGMGFGDVKLSFFIGFFLGIQKLIISFYISFLTGALVSLILMIVGKKGMKDKIAFGPFMVLATVISMFFGGRLWQFFKFLIGVL